MTRKDFEDRIEETAERASKVIERPPDELKPRAKETMDEFISELEELYKLLVITDQEAAGIQVEPRQVVLEQKHQEALKRISDILYDTYIKMGKKEEAQKWKERAESIARSETSENSTNG